MGNRNERPQLAGAPQPFTPARHRDQRDHPRELRLVDLETPPRKERPLLPRSPRIDVPLPSDERTSDLTEVRSILVDAIAKIDGLIAKHRGKADLTGAKRRHAPIPRQRPVPEPIPQQEDDGFNPGHIQDRLQEISGFLANVERSLEGL